MLPTGPSSRGPAESGPKLTVFAYGQTGSGKTYTMEAVSNAAIGRLLAWTAAPQLQPAPVYLVMTLFEIYGEKCYVSPPPYSTNSHRAMPCKVAQMVSDLTSLNSLSKLACVQNVLRSAQASDD